MTDDISTPPPARSTPSSLGVPVAIIIAGGLIALSIYFGGSAAQTPAPANQVATVSAAPAPAQPTVGPLRPIGADDHVRGAVSAKVTIMEYSDLECPFCKQYHMTLQRLLKEYPNDLRWVYRHHPIPQLHQQAPAEAMAVECAGEQGKFWELLDKIYAITPSNDGLNLEELPTYAREVGVANIATFNACRQANKYQQRIDTDSQEVQQVGTPYSVLIGPDGKEIPINGAQPYEQVKGLIDQALGA